MMTSINIITHKEVISIRDFSTNFKELHQIVKLAMNITADNDRSSHWLDVRVLYKNFFSLNINFGYLFAQLLDLLLRKWFARVQVLDLPI